MPGFTTILLTPDDGISDVLDETTRSILVEEVEEAFTRLDVLEELAAEIALVGTGDEVVAARELHEALWEVVGCLESYQSRDVAADSVLRARTARDVFAHAARAGLHAGVDVGALDSRPRYVENSDPESV